jgi:hypothetical protein
LTSNHPWASRDSPSAARVRWWCRPMRLRANGNRLSSR